MVCEKIIELSNHQLDLLDIGDNIKAEIKQGWEKPAIINNVATVTNTADHAVFVEFGVGLVGSQNKHPMADTTNYQYDVNSEYKQADRSWTFILDEAEDLDISEKNIINKVGLTITTKGQEGHLFVYNAIVDFTMKYYAEQIWHQVKYKYWRE